jgi:hypothetical protein
VARLGISFTRVGFQLDQFAIHGPEDPARARRSMTSEFAFLGLDHRGQQRTRVLAGKAGIRSTISVVVWGLMGVPVSGQCGWPRMGA